jgi:predicted membrane protein
MKTPYSRQHAGAQIVVGIAVIAIGFLFLFDNLGWLQLDMGMQFWPVVLIAAGVLKITQSRSRHGTAVGGFLLVFGAVMLLNGLGLLTVGWNVLAPMLMIGAGLLLVLRSAGRRPPHGKAGAADARDVDPAQENTVDTTTVLGAYRRRMATQSFGGGDITVIMAGCDLDLRQASIDGVAVLNVFALMGGINIKVPLDWTVEMDGVPLVGGFQDFTVHPKDGGKRLIVRGSVVMGGLDVRN